MPALNRTNFTSKSSENFMLHSASLWKNVLYNKALGQFEGDSLGATTSGVKVSIAQNMRQAEIDGVLTKVKGNDYIEGTDMTVETTLKEWTIENLKASLISTSRDAVVDEAPAGYKVLEPKHKIDDTDYLKDIAVFGLREGDDAPILIVMEYGLSVSGLGAETANHSEAGIPVTFEARAEDPTAVGGAWKIYFPGTVKPVTGITIPGALAIAIAGVKPLVVTIAPVDATNPDLKYTSSDNAIASVDVEGHVIGVAAGIATITVKTGDGKFTGTCTVTVS